MHSVRYLVALTVLLISLTANAASPTPVGTVVRHIGDVYAVGPLGSRELHNGRTLYKGDTLVTGKKARLLIKLRTGALVTLGENSRFGILELAEQQPNGQKRTLFRLVKGVFRSIAELANPKDTLEVETAVATMGIRGTDFWGGFHFGDGKLDVTLIDGSGVYVRNQLGQVELSIPGEGTTVAPGQTPSTVKNWPKKKLDQAFASVAFPDTH